MTSEKIGQIHSIDSDVTHCDLPQWPTCKLLTFLSTCFLAYNGVMDTMSNESVQCHINFTNLIVDMMTSLLDCRREELRRVATC